MNKLYKVITNKNRKFFVEVADDSYLKSAISHNLKESEVADKVEELATDYATLKKEGVRHLGW